MHIFYLPDLTPGLVELPGEEATHALRVLRLKDGDRITLVDGRGTKAEARLRIGGKREAQAEITSRLMVPHERKAAIHLAVAPTKQIERFEWMLEKCTEIGVDRITPLITSRTERTRLRRDRLEKILIAAMKQSQRAWLPRLDEATSLEAILRSSLPEQRFFGWCEGERNNLSSAYDRSHDAVILIGPEGDFTPEESALLTQHAFVPVSLGGARLRTETAAIAACTWMNFAQQH